MQLNDIDNLFKRGIAESENQQETQLTEAKSRIWEAIQKPKPKKRTNWILVTSLAATVSMFAIATVLFLKLESKQKELEMLQVMVDTKTPSKIGYKEIESAAAIPKKEATSATVPPPAQVKDLAIGIETKEENVKEETNLYKPEPIAPVEMPKTELIAATDPILIINHEIDLEPVILAPIPKETAIKSKQKKKIKLKIGNGNPDYHGSQNALAFNIKL